MVLASDGDYAMPLAVTLRSIAESNRHAWPLDFHVLCEGFPEGLRRRVAGSLPEGSASIRWVDVDMALFTGFETTLSHLSPMTYSRLLIPRLFPESVSRVLYLDTDVLVLDDLAPLWNTDLEGAVLGAVLDNIDPLLKQGLPPSSTVPTVQDYFNAGVLLIDLKRWRDDRVSERAIRYLQSHRRTSYADQDALNVVCDGSWMRLPERWNLHRHWDTRLWDLSVEDRPAIVHFVHRAKPWLASSVSVNAGFYDAFRNRTRFRRSPRDRFSDLAQTSWSRTKNVLKSMPPLRFAWNHLNNRGQSTRNP